MKNLFRTKYILLTLVIIVVALFVSVIEYRSHETTFVKNYVESRYVKYDGKVNVSGKYEMSRCIPENDVCDSSWKLEFIVDNNTSSKIPRVDGDNRMAWFSFQNQEDISGKFGIYTPIVDNDKSICKISGQAMITIRDYTEFTAASMGSDHTNLVNVISHGIPVFGKCE